MKKCIHTLSNGDLVWHDTANQSIQIDFSESRKVLSTSLLNGGYREDLKKVFNHYVGDHGGKCPIKPGQTYAEHMYESAKGIGLDPKSVTGMGTAARMENVAIRVEQFDALTVTAIVTGGVEVNGGRVGDPTEHYLTVDKKKLHRPGTINIMLVIDADLPEGMLARALVTCTEAKTAALQELMAGSNYSTGLATGSGTDQTVILANPHSELYFESAGKHSKLGELIGKAVKPAVKEALFKQHGLSPEQQHSILRRMKRWGVNVDTLWQGFKEEVQGSKDTFEEMLMQLDRHPIWVTYTSLYIHLLDQLNHGLLDPNEVQEAGNEMLERLAAIHGISAVQIKGEKLQDFLNAYQKQLAKCLETMTIDTLNVM